jgi:hypothetical protein
MDPFLTIYQEYGEILEKIIFLSLFFVEIENKKNKTINKVTIRQHVFSIVVQKCPGRIRIWPDPNYLDSTPAL